MYTHLPLYEEKRGTFKQHNTLQVMQGPISKQVLIVLIKRGTEYFGQEAADDIKS